MKYVSLHHHSTFSYMDGYGTPEQHDARAAELGMSALFLTEHGNVSSYVQHEKAALKHGIKPGFGLEAYIGPANMRETGNTRKWHLTLLAMDQIGYQNLMRLVTRSYAEGFYQWPTISGEMLKEHNEGIIALSGCLDGKIACDLLGGKGREKGSERDAIASIRRFHDLFGDRFYLETQMFPELDRAHKLNQWFAEQSKKHGIPLVATADCHYPHPDDNKMQVILHAAGRGSGSVEATEASWEYDIRLTHPTSDKLVIDRLMGTGLTRLQAQGAARSTVEIAERCNVVLPKADRLRFPLPQGKSSQDVIWEWLRDGWRYRAQRNKRLISNKSEYVQRLNYEMEIIQEKDFIDYFLMLSDLVRWAKDNGIPVGPARGSAAASLACYLLRITEVDPLQFPMMMFERFIALDRHDIPDVDLDFSDERRDEVRQRAVEVYGADRVGNIGTFTKYKGKNSLDDVGRVYNVPEFAVATVKGLMIERSSGDARAEATLTDTMDTFPQVRAVFEKYPDLTQALRLEGNYRGMSIHAAGIVIANAPLTEVCATYEREMKDNKTGEKIKRQVVSVNKYDAEYQNIMKADFLGLANMGMIQHALDMIGMTLDDLYTTTQTLDDPKVIKAFRDGDVTGIFQFGGGATRIVNADVRPDNFLELSDINALSRPGPLHSGATQEYIDIKHGRKKAKALDPALQHITGWTKEQIIYQEQILAIVREIGGFDWTHAQEIRKIISLKHGEAAFNMREGRFLEGAERLHGIKAAVAKQVWVRMATAGTYAFNIAHSVSYSILAYWTMWLKVYHPLAFYAAALRKQDDERYWLLRDALRHKVDIAPPDPNTSDITWSIKEGKVAAGLAQVRGIGEKLAAAITNDRDANGPFHSWEELIRVKGIGPSKMNDIRQMDGEDPFNIYVVDRQLKAIRQWLKENGKEAGLPKPTHRASEIPTNAGDVEVVWIGIPQSRDPRDVIEDERGRSGKTVEEIKRSMRDPHLTKRMVVQAIDDTDVPVFLRWNRWNFPRYEKAIWNMRLADNKNGNDVVLVKGIKRRGFGTSIQVRGFWVIDPDD